MCKSKQCKPWFLVLIVQKVEIKKNIEKLLTDRGKDCIIIHVKTSKIPADRIGWQFRRILKWKRRVLKK